jgi:23S rRNA (uracil1939-C5)-methyltransferase
MLSECMITSYNSEGEGVSKTVEGKTLFIPGALKGERVSYSLSQDQKRLSRGQLVEIIAPSEQRVDPICPVYSRCGGCSIMHAQYQEQLSAKQKRVEDALVRIGGFSDHLLQPILQAPSAFHYRTKITLHRTEDGWGFYEKKSRIVVRIDECPIFEPQGNQLLKAFLTLKGTDSLEEVTLRTSTSHAQQLLILKGGPTPPLKEWYSQLETPFLKGIIHLGPRSNPTIFGSSEICQSICNQEFFYSYDSFFQIFPKAAEKLFSYAIEKAELRKTDSIIDAHCGVGVIGLLCAPHVHKVEGYEVVPNAITFAKKNATHQQISNAHFYRDSLKNVPSTIETLFLNPPRGGCIRSLLDQVKSKKIIYISCDPGTLSRDLKILSKKYSVDWVQPFDLFPQTMHVENVALLTK